VRLKLRIRKKKRSNDNPPDKETEPEGEWWRAALTSHSTAQINRAFREERVGGILLDTVRGVVPSDERFFDSPVVFIRLNVPTHRIDRDGMELCLSELGIGLLEPVLEETEEDAAETHQGSIDRNGNG
jgi:hypothetical protein